MSNCAVPERFKRERPLQAAAVFEGRRNERAAERRLPKI